MAGVGRRSKPEQQEKEKLVYKWLMEGWTPKLIIEELMANHSFKTEDNCRYIINKVVKSLAPNNDEEIADLKNKYIEMYNHLYMKAFSNGEIKTAQSIIDSMVKLQGLITNKVEAKIDTTFTIEF